MGEPNVEAAWRAEFKRIHAAKAPNSVPDEPQAAFRWSGDEAETQRLQEEHTHHYLRWTFLGSVAVIIVGLIGTGLSFLD